jgi:hypothetical protein
MAREYDIEWRGIKIHCKSTEDAAALLKKLGEPARPELEPWSAHEFLDFTGRIQFQQKKFLWFLKECGENTDELARTILDIEGNQALAGILSGITKVAMAMDIDHLRVYRQRTKYEKGRPVRLYDLAPVFRKATLEFDWPSASEVESFG